MKGTFSVKKGTGLDGIAGDDMWKSKRIYLTRC